MNVGAHKGRPYESFHSVKAAGAADEQSPPSFSRDCAGGLPVGELGRVGRVCESGPILPEPQFAL